MTMMTLDRNVFLGVLVCMSLGGLTGCDTSEDDVIAELQPGETIAPIDVVMGPMAEHPTGSIPAAEHGIASGIAAARSESVPVAGGVGRFIPSDSDMIGWVRWANAQPTPTGPIADQTGEQCGAGQDGPIWYLAGTFGGPVERECDIPAGKQLVLPLVNQWCVYPVEFYPTEESIIADLPLYEEFYQSIFSEVCALTLRLDGEELLDYETMSEELYLQVMDPFEILLNDEHWATEWFAGGVMPATAAGYYARLPPLTPGDHVLELGGERCGDSPFSTYARYELHIGG
jgi:hypothetical protein